MGMTRSIQDVTPRKPPVRRLTWSPVPAVLGEPTKHKRARRHTRRTRKSGVVERTQSQCSSSEYLPS
eukprot:12559441-Prorocentrum_lima.AAC.1